MRAEAREKRKEAIEEAAIILLIEGGYDRLSMLAVARRVRASNETLYRWYGDKTGLFKALVDRNAQRIRRALDANTSEPLSPVETLRAFGPSLLEVLTGPAAIALNRAAAADPSGTLGSALASVGRDAVLPVLARLMASAQKTGFLARFDTETAVDLYLSLLIGDLQVRLVTRAVGEVSDSEIAMRAQRAWLLLEGLAAASLPDQHLR